MFVFKRIRARCGLFRSGAVQLQAAPPSRADAAPGLTLAEVRLSALGVSLQRRTVFLDRKHGGR